MVKRALIHHRSGWFVQSEFLLVKGYEVHGIIRRASTFITHCLDHIHPDSHNCETKRK